MINLYPFLFRFGVSFNYGIPKEIIHSLVKFFQEKYNIEIFLTQNEDNYDCIAIKDNEAKDFTPILAHKFTERLQEYSLNDYGNSILFIDTKRAYSDKFIDRFLIPEVIKIKNEKELVPKPFPNFILYFDELGYGSLTYDTLFTSHLKHGILDFCFVFDKNGKVLNSKLEFENDNTLHKLINDTSTSSLERFQFKLVRKINHFKRFDEDHKIWAACQQFFYEGRKCQDEVFQMLMDELLKLRNNENLNPHYIIYDSLQSEWLTKAIETTVNHISSVNYAEMFNNYHKKNNKDFDNHLNLCDKEDKRNEESWQDKRDLEIIFVVDLIHTGTTFRDKIKKVSKKFPNAKIHCLSALVTDVAVKEFKDSFEEVDRKIKINDSVIKYFKNVEQIYIPRSSNKTECNMCKHKLLPPVNASAEITKNLSSYEMWFMSEESGFKIEDYRPRKSREDINRVIPNSLKLFKKNGTLLAIKFEEHLKLAGIYPQEEIVIIFPDETKNDPEKGDPPESIEKTPSGYFAKCLNFYNENYSYLGIPRKMIRMLEESGANWDNIKKQFPKILKQIEDIDKHIVIVDEVNFTGKTFRTITDIIRNQGKYPVCYFPIFNFDAIGTLNKYNDNQYDIIKFLNLYELEFGYE